MPLIKSRSQKAFKKNIETEMEHGKPQAQSLAIAYDMKRRAPKKKMADGGNVAENGVATKNQNAGKNNSATNEAGIASWSDMKKNMGFAEGGMPEDRSKMSGKSGMVRTDTEANQNQRGVHQHGYKGQSGGISESGAKLRDYGSQPEKQNIRYAKAEASHVKPMHRETLSELKSMPNPKLKGLAEGGEIEEDFQTEDRPNTQEEIRDRSEIMRMKRDKMTPIKSPRMVESQAFKAHLLDEYGRKVEEDQDPKNLMPGDHDDMEKGPSREEYDAQHFAKGGMSDFDRLMHPVETFKEAMQPNKTDYNKGDDTGKQKTAPDDYDPSISAGENKALLGHAEGGMLDEEEMDERHNSLAAAIMARKRRKMMAEGGQVDLEKNNAEESPNEYYRQNEHEALKENYDQDLWHADDPMDSNEHGDNLDEDEHDMVSSIRRKMKSRRQF